MKHLWLALGCLVACGSKSQAPHKKDDAPPVEKRGGVHVDTGAPQVNKQSTDMHVVRLDEPVIELPRQEAFAVTAPGAEPRVLLKYALVEANATYAAETKLTTRHIGDNAQWTKPEQLPTIHDGFAIATQPTNLQLRPLPAELGGKSTPDAEQYIASWTANLANHRANATIDPRGQIGKLFFNDDPKGERTADAKDELAQRLLSTIVPLPDAPVGAGATWRVVTILREGHAYVKQTATYKLVTTTAPWKIAIDIRRIGEEQRVVDARLPKNTFVDLLALLHTVTGTLTIDPKRPIGTGTLTVSSQIHARIMSGDPAKAAPQPNSAYAPPGTIEQLVEDTGTVTLSVGP